MKKLKNILLITIGVACINSCNILDLQPLDQLSEADVWSDTGLMEMYVNSCYHGVLHGFSSSNLAMFCDEGYSNDSTHELVLSGSLDQENIDTRPTELHYWNHAYSHIRKINTFLEKVGNSVATDEERESMSAEVRFIRAFIYANLIWRYGGVPIIDDTFGLNDDFTAERDTYDACVEFIREDLRYAMTILPDKRSADTKGRASADACQALLSRVLLYHASPLNNPTNDKSRWQAASDAAEALIGTRYDLHIDYRTTFTGDNSEIIFARWFSQSTGTDFHVWTGRLGSDGHGIPNPNHNMACAYEMKATGLQPYIFRADGTRVVNTASGYDPQNPYKGRDPRFHASILYDGSVWAERETQTWEGGADSPEAGFNGSKTRYYLKKFLDEDLPPAGSSNKHVSPWIHFRYAEILLNYAEAQFELGNEAEARRYINMVRDRTGVEMPHITESGAELRERIYNERRVELMFEGHRFFDVRRWKIAEVTEARDLLRMRITRSGDTKTYYEEKIMGRSFPKRLYLLPIARAEIERSLNSLTQNEGY